MPPDSVSLPHIIAQAHSSNKFVQGHRSTRPLATRREKRDATLSGTGPPMKDEESVSSGGTEAKDVRDSGAGDLIKRISQTDVDTPDASSSRRSASLGDLGSTTIPERTLLRDPELWFDDGNLVLVAGDVQFCVYKGLLTSQSAVFKDMLSLPQPVSDDANVHDGPSPNCASVHLSDSPEDLRHFLRAFTNGKLRYVINPTFQYRTVVNDQYDTVGTSPASTKSPPASASATSTSATPSSRATSPTSRSTTSTTSTPGGTSPPSTRPTSGPSTASAQ